MVEITFTRKPQATVPEPHEYCVQEEDRDRERRERILPLAFSASPDLLEQKPRARGRQGDGSDDGDTVTAQPDSLAGV